MARKGGYLILDFKGIEQTADGATKTNFAGAYGSLEANTKFVVLSGLVVGGVEFGDCVVAPYVNNSEYQFDAYGYTITVDANDDVIITAG